MDGKRIELRAIPLVVEQIVPGPLDEDVPRVNRLEHTYEMERIVSVAQRVALHDLQYFCITALDSNYVLSCIKSLKLLYDSESHEKK